MHIIEAFGSSIHPVLVHDGIRIFRANHLAVELLRYSSPMELVSLNISSIIAPESKWMSAKRVEQLRKKPNDNLPEARLIFIRKDGTLFEATVHTKTLRWAFLENYHDMEELRSQLDTDIIFYSWGRVVHEP